MNKFTLLTSICLLLVASSHAKIRRVGFFGIPVAGTDYVSFAAAQTAAAANDTILMFPGTNLDGQVTKKLIIIGNGTLLDPGSTPKGNANQQAFSSESTITNVTLAAGSDGTIVMGFRGGSIYINVSDITLRRNRDILVYLGYTAFNINNFKALENYSLNLANYAGSGLTATNMNISNNLIYQMALGGTNTYSGNISNNVWAFDNTAAGTNGGASTLSYGTSINFGGGAFLFQNNLLVSYNSAIAANNSNYFVFSGGGNTVFNYNVALQTTIPQNWGAGTGNVIVPIANATNIFVAFPLIGSASADGRYALTAGSPALMGNRPGSSADAGIYGGPSPYKLSTLPSIPSIYQLSSPQGNNPVGSTIQINLSTKGNN